MEVILKEDVADLGFRGEVVKVADGYARNYLLPRKLAMQANEANKAVIEQMKARPRAALRAKRRRPRNWLPARAGGAQLYAQVRRTGPSFWLGHLVRHRRGVGGAGLEVDRRKIQLGDAIKSLGDFKVAIRLHREVTARVTVKVQAEVTEEEKVAAANAASAAPAEEATEPAAEEATAE